MCARRNAGLFQGKVNLTGHAVLLHVVDGKIILYFMVVLPQTSVPRLGACGGLPPLSPAHAWLFEFV